MYKAFTEKPIQRIGEDGKRLGRQKIGLPPEKLLEMYRDMLRARLFDEKLVLILRQGKTSFYSQSTGMEGTQIGLAHAIRAGHDWVWPYYRDQGLMLALGVPARDLLAQFMGLESDQSKARQMPHHFSSRAHRVVSCSSSIANQVAPAAGMAMAQKYLGLDEITVCTFGDGATSEGDWHAGVNMAAVNGAPVLFVCENNQYAISAGLESQMKCKNVSSKGRAYGIPGYFVDGQDVVAVQEVMLQAAEEVRAGGGPVLVEALTYRIGTHSSADDDSKYRSREEVQLWKSRDPIMRLERYLECEGILPDATGRQALQQSIRSELEQILHQLNLESGPSWRSMFEDVYSDLPLHLQEQYQSLEVEQLALERAEALRRAGSRERAEVNATQLIGEGSY